MADVVHDVMDAAHVVDRPVTRTISFLLATPTSSPPLQCACVANIIVRLFEQFFA